MKSQQTHSKSPKTNQKKITTNLNQITQNHLTHHRCTTTTPSVANSHLQLKLSHHRNTKINQQNQLLIHTIETQNQLKTQPHHQNLSQNTLSPH